MSFSNVTYDEAMRRARECVPVLRERAQKCEDARVLLPENEKLRGCTVKCVTGYLQ
jgi:hypothetical protein